MTSCVCCRASIVANPIHNGGLTTGLKHVKVSVPYGSRTRSLGNLRVRGVRASAVESYDGSSNFVNRMEKAWLISKESNGVVIFIGSRILPERKYRITLGFSCNMAYATCIYFGFLWCCKSNHSLLLVPLATQMGILSANGVLVQASLFLAITCFAKSLQKALVVLYVLERDQ